MFIENIKFSGKLNILLVDHKGNVKLDETYSNLVVSTGKEYIVQRMVSNATAVMSHMAVGTVDTVPGVQNTMLGGEISRAQISSANTSSNTATFICVFDPDVGTGPLVEAGIFNSATANSGIMLCRTKFPVVNKEELDTVTITWNISAI